jgi:protein-tyrosine phosphatase/membrane-associated phospholipid phosphatase
MTTTHPTQPAPAPRVILRVLWMTFCTALFLFLYGACLFVTAHRADVPSLYFAWERHIPYMPWMIVPYMSIDLFFLASFFVVRTRDELNALGRRLALALVVASLCFLLFPLRYGFAVPDTPGALGKAIAAFRGFDRPFNLAPSLHIAFRAVLWVVYVRHTRGLLRTTAKTWLILVGLSTLLVYQHHLFDVLTGHMLGLFCIYLIPEARLHTTRCTPRRDVAAAYAVGALSIVGIAVAPGGWFYVLLWPATSLALVAFAYFTGNPDLFRKREGRVPTAARAVLFPCLLGQRLAWHIQKRNVPAASPITTNLLIGRRLSCREADALAVTTIVDLTAESDSIRRAGVHSISVPMLDLTLPTLKTLDKAVRAVRAAAQNGPVYVHCALGYGRSASVAAAYLFDTGESASVDDAIRRVQSARPGAVFPPRAVTLLRQYALFPRHDAASDDGDRPPRARDHVAVLPPSPAARL